MARLIPRFLLALALPALGACSDIAGSSDVEELFGTYQLITVDGDPPPVIVDQDATATLEITAGTVTLSEDGFVDATTTRLTVNGVPTTEITTAQGTWSLSSRTVRFTPDDDSGEYTMTWDEGDKLTQVFEGHVLVYQR
jgi:hypothetical protein